MSSLSPVRSARWIALPLLAALLLSTTPASAGTPDAGARQARVGSPGALAPDQLPSTCRVTGVLSAARALMADRYTFRPHPTVTLPHTLTWTEDPLHDNNWRFQLHALRWLLVLPLAWRKTGDPAFLARAVELAQSWLAANPISNPPSNMSWNDMATGHRAGVLSCLARVLPAREAWLQAALRLHGSTLADPAFYSVMGNHALNQNIGLLEVGCWLGRASWMDLAQDRTNTLIVQSVDSQGASNERSVGYELYNYRRYLVAAQRLRECGRQPSATFARLTKMPRFLALATLPNGRYLTIGDSLDAPATSLPGTVAEFAATRGTSGPKPRTTIGVYKAGFVFGRTGWGETRPFTDEAMFSVRFGPSVTIHGHRDGGAVTLYGYGRQLVVDPGLKDYQVDSFRSFFESPAAHNVLYLPDYPEIRGWSTSLVRSQISPGVYDATLNLGEYAGVSLQRRVTFSRRLGYLVVDDTMSSTSVEEARQVWHLRADRAITRSGASTWTRGVAGDVLIRQLLPGGSTSVIKGRLSPLQGWLPHGWGHVEGAPVVQQAVTGSSVRLLTLLVPFRTATPDVTVSRLTTGTDAFSFVIGVGAARQRVDATPTSATITDLR